MLKLCQSVLEAVGETPMVRLRRLTAERAPAVYLKLEFLNPGGSSKDRIAVAMVEAAERAGVLKQGGTIVEATEGNTGVGLAMVAAVKGYRCLFVVPDKLSTEKIRLLKAYGAEVVVTPASAPSNSPEGYSGVAARLVHEVPNAWQPSQFTNPVNPEYHYHVTGPEIWYQTEGTVTVFVAGVGTGGTISGVGRYLKERKPSLKVIGADPEGSILSGDQPKSWEVEGIGQDHVPQTFNAQIVDKWVRVSDADAFMTGRALAQQEGLLLGGSSGTVVAAALRQAERLTPEDVVVALCPDAGHHYLSKMYSDEWMIKHGFLRSIAAVHTVGELLESRGAVDLISVSPSDSADQAIKLMRQHEISQLPVLDHRRSVGSIRELTVARLLHARLDPRQVSVSEIMAQPMPQLEDKADLDEAYRLLSAGHTGVLVVRDDAVRGIVTRIDLVTFWDQAGPEG